MITHLVKQAIIITLYVSAPIVLMTVVVGLLLGFLQAIMQLQDQALPFGVKLVGAVFVMIILGPWMAQILIQFTNSLFELMPILGKS